MASASPEGETGQVVDGMGVTWVIRLAAAFHLKSRPKLTANWGQKSRWTSFLGMFLKSLELLKQWL